MLPSLFYCSISQPLTTFQLNVTRHFLQPAFSKCTLIGYHTIPCNAFVANFTYISCLNVSTTVMMNKTIDLDILTDLHVLRPREYWKLGFAILSVCLYIYARTDMSVYSSLAIGWILFIIGGCPVNIKQLFCCCVQLLHY